MTTNISSNKISLEEIQAWPKLLSHEHCDCSPRGRTIVELSLDEPASKVPKRFKNAMRRAKTEAERDAVGMQFQEWVAQFASKSLDNYLDAIVHFLLPCMQTRDNLYRLFKERIEDAVADGVIGMKLRFAPQLHRAKGLTLQQVMDVAQQAVSEAPFPVTLVVCSLRHENGRLGWHLANLVINNPLASSYDLAGSETKFPGVLRWWARQARRVTAAGKQVLCHIGETNPITAEDLRILAEIGCSELGHAINGDPGTCLCTVCVTSNIVTGQVPNARSHRIDEMYRLGYKVTVDTDGTLFTRTTASGEYKLLIDTFGWTKAHFLKCNLNALEHFPVSASERARIEKILRAAYE